MSIKDSLGHKQSGQGKNSLSIRHQNEVAVINFMRRHGKASRIQLAEDLGITSQAIAIITNKLVESELIITEGKHYSKTPGQPPAIYQLNPQGAYSVGISVGRTHTSVVLLDFCGKIQMNKKLSYDVPDPDEILKFIITAHESIMSGLSDLQKTKNIGVGLSMPYHIYEWTKEMDYPVKVMKKWEGYKLADKVSQKIGKPVLLEKDMSASAIGEVFFGNKKRLGSFLYIYIGTFPGGGVIMNDKLVPGKNSNAGSIGSILIPDSNFLRGNIKDNDYQQPVQFISRSGIHTLSKYLAKEGITFKSSVELLNRGKKDNKIGKHIQNWTDDLAEAIAYVTISANALMDFEAVVIDATLPGVWINDLVKKSSKAYDKLEHRGIIKPMFRKGSHGLDARVLGSAALPFYEIFSKKGLD